MIKAYRGFTDVSCYEYECFVETMEDYCASKYPEQTLGDIFELFINKEEEIDS